MITKIELSGRAELDFQVDRYATVLYFSIELAQARKIPLFNEISHQIRSLYREIRRSDLGGDSPSGSTAGSA